MAREWSKNRVDDKVNPQVLDDIERILGRRNLQSSLYMINKVAYFVDPEFGVPFPTEEDYKHASLAEKQVLALRQATHLHTLAFLALVALWRANVHLGRELTKNDLIDAINLYNDYNVPMLLGGADLTLNRFFIRVSFLQFPFQIPWWANLASAHFMYSGAVSTNGFSLGDAVQHVIGLNFANVVKFCVTLFLVSKNLEGAPLRLDDLDRMNVPGLDRQTAEQILPAISQTQQEFRDTYKVYRSEDARLRPYDFNPLFYKPIVVVGEHLFIPVPQLLTMWATSGIAYHLSARYGHGTFYPAFGRAFEDFIEHLLKKSGRPFMREITYSTPRGEAKTADFVLIEGTNAVIFDCKTRRFSVHGRYGLQDDLERELRECVIKGLAQVIRTHRLMQERHPAVECLHGIKEVVYAVVTLDELFMANVPPMKEYISRATQRLAPNQKYHVLSSREFEIIISCLTSSDSLFSLLKLKEQTETTYDSPIEPFISDWLQGEGRKVSSTPSKELSLSYLRDIERRMT